MSLDECIEYDVTYLSPIEIKGKLLLFSDKVLFLPTEEEAEKIEIPVVKIRDARLATKKDISALRVFLLGATLGVLLPIKHKLLIVDYEDELGIIQHLTFKGEAMEEAVGDLYDIRRKERTEPTKKAEQAPRKQLNRGNWQCQRCFRINAATAKLCTRCGEPKEVQQ